MKLSVAGTIVELLDHHDIVTYAITPRIEPVSGALQH